MQNPPNCELCSQTLTKKGKKNHLFQQQFDWSNKLPWRSGIQTEYKNGNTQVEEPKGKRGYKESKYQELQQPNRESWQRLQDDKVEEDFLDSMDSKFLGLTGLVLPNFMVGSRRRMILITKFWELALCRRTFLTCNLDGGWISKHTMEVPLQALRFLRSYFAQEKLGLRVAST